VHSNRGLKAEFWLKLHYRIAERNASSKREGAVIAGSILDTRAQKKQKLEGGLSSKV
jgi:hypothetical protein